MNISAVILSAGRSSRMGFPKAFLQWQGKSFIENIYDNLISAGVDEVIVVFSKFVNLPENVNLKKARFVKNPFPEKGMLSSFRCALRSLKSPKQNVMLCLVDHPAVKPETYQMMVSAARKDKIIIPVFNGKRGHPVIFGADFINELLEKNCPEGARTVIRAHQNAVVEFSVNDAGILLDIDTPNEAKNAGASL